LRYLTRLIARSAAGVDKRGTPCVNQPRGSKQRTLCCPQRGNRLLQTTRQASRS